MKLVYKNGFNYEDYKYKICNDVIQFWNSIK